MAALGGLLFGFDTGVINVVFTVVAILLLDRVGRRKLLPTGTVGLTLALVVLGVFFQWPTLQRDAAWLAVVALVIFIASFAIGLGPVFWLMLCEIFPLRERSHAMSVFTEIGRQATFWLYAGFGVLAVLFFAVRVPETKGRTLEEIERDLGGGTAPQRGHGRPQHARAG